MYKALGDDRRLVDALFGTVIQQLVVASFGSRSITMSPDKALRRHIPRQSRGSRVLVGREV